MNAELFQKFLAWEKATRDTIDFKKVYVDIAGGDILGGLVLSELVYWYLPDKNGNANKLRVVRENVEWIVCSRSEWWERTRMNTNQIDHILKKLEKDYHLIHKTTHFFSRKKQLHVRIEWETFFLLWNSMINNPPQNPYKKSKSETSDIVSKSEISDLLDEQVGNNGTSKTENTSSSTTQDKRITASEKNDADVRDTPPEHSDSKTVKASNATPSKQKEKAVQSGTQQTDNLTNVPPKLSDGLQPEKPAQRQRNPMFDAVCEHIFGISSPEELKVLNETEGAGSRIMTVALWLNGKIDRYKKGGNSKTKPTVVGFITQPAEIEHTKLFAKDWKKVRPNSDVPRDLETFALRWREWVSKKGGALNTTVNGAAPKRRGYDAKRILALVEKEGISGDEAFKRLYPNG